MIYDIGYMIYYFKHRANANSFTELENLPVGRLLSSSKGTAKAIFRQSCKVTV